MCVCLSVGLFLCVKRGEPNHYNVVNFIVYLPHSNYFFISFISCLHCAPNYTVLPCLTLGADSRPRQMFMFNDSY